MTSINEFRWVDAKQEHQAGAKNFAQVFSSFKSFDTTEARQNEVVEKYKIIPDRIQLIKISTAGSSLVGYTDS